MKLYSAFPRVLPGLMIVISPLISFAQTVEVRNAVRMDVSIPLRDMKPVKKTLFERWFPENEREIPNKFRTARGGEVPDGALQQVYNNETDAAAVTLSANFNGLTNGANSGRVTPPDPAGDVGPNHYVEAVNCMLQIFDKTGTSLYGPVTTSTIWSGFSGNWSGTNDGDAIILYDENADRWIISQFAIDCTTTTPYEEYQLVAVSTSSDPTGSYYRYAFQFDYMPDYPKLSVWQDGYYMAINRFNTNITGTPFVGAGACAMERSKMLTGDAGAQMIYFKTETLGGSGSSAGGNCYSMLPSDCDGTFPAAGTPNYFIYDDQASSELRIWALQANWTTPSSSTFTYVTALPVSSYTELTNSAAVTQPGTTLKLDGLGDRLMFRNQYRNWGSYETFVTCRSVLTGGVGAMRWYEFRKTGSTFSLYQQSTYAPGDGKARWMGSIAMNAAGDIAMAYSVSSSTTYPSIYCTGRKASDPLNQMTAPEGVIYTGTASMTGTYTRWGDYTAMNIDPTDNITFWTTQEYVGTYGGSYPWATRIASFRMANPPVVTTLAATGITSSAATLNGTVNPNGMATTYHFEWGTTTAYGNNTTTTAAGSGSSAVAVSAGLSGLVSGTTYHYRLSAVNGDGTSNGSDLTFAPGGALLTTTAATSITTTTASSGGNITADGGYAVTARGVCWGASANPTVSGSHTTDGSGTGIFTSSITGLVANTTYHIRAYAVNANGTWYGDDLQFTTLCGSYTLPFTEGFTSGVLPTCWSIVDIQGSGQVWQFGTITGQSPNPALTGSYAYLNSDLFGSGNTQNTDLVSPTINLSAYSAVTLAFNHYFKAYTGSSGTVSYSINNGSTWTALTSFTTTSATNPIAYSQAVSAVAGQSQVKFKWNYTGTYGYYWGIDDISITGTVAGGPTVTTTAASGITGTTATAGGNVTAAGGSAVTARGVCWSTSANPVVTGNHTTDGSGTGAFTSSLTGLSPSTTYHIRAYATNTTGTSYGSDLTFSTTCSTIASFPWTEGFENAGSSPACWTQEQVSSSGINWTFITGSGNSHPAGAHGGTYNACLKDVTTGDNKTRLISPPINLLSVNSPVLTFWHTQALWSPDQDYLIVYYRTSASGTWTQLASYTASITAWTMETLSLPGGTADYYICFEGNARYGYGVCVDDIQVSCTALPVSLSIAASVNPSCSGSPVTFTATPANGGASPSYQWKVNSVNAGTGSTYIYAPATGDAVTCVFTSSASCVTGNPATSNTVTMTVSPVITAAFTADKLTPAKNETVQLTDQSTGTPAAWNWSFDRGTVTYVNGTTASSQNPWVQFTDGGPYTVTLQASNAACTNTLAKTAYIRAGIAGLWTGSTSTAWNVTTNWDNWLVPTGSTSVTIPASALNWPVFTGNLTLGVHCSTFILSGTTSKLTITGDLIIQ